MKVNQTKAIIACLGIAAAAAIAGSVSGTVAWFQYNTRAVAEFTGTTAKCTEFLQVRTVKAATGTPIRAKVADVSARDGLADPQNGDKVLVDADKKIYTYDSSTSSWGEGVLPSNGDKVKAESTVYKYDGSAWSAITVEYGTWGISLSNADILEAAGRADNKLSPVTMPFESPATENDPAGTLYGQPVCGYELYANTEPYHWQEAETSDYMSFSLQFRVLDVDGGEATPTSLIETNLYLTDLTIVKKNGSTKEDISSAVRVHMHSGDKNNLMAYGDGTAATISTATAGKLDLNLNNVLDNETDVPGAHYSFNNPVSPADLTYGNDKPVQVAYDAHKSDSGLYPTNDGAGHLTGGSALAVTNGSVPASDAAYTTVDFKIWLEGWAKLPGPDNLGEVGASNSIWSSAKYIGSEFNVGMSFGVTTLD